MTRNSGELRLPHIRTETGMRQLAYSGLQFYNKVCRAQTQGKIYFRAALLGCLRSETWHGRRCRVGSVNVCMCELFIMCACLFNHFIFYIVTYTNEKPRCRIRVKIYVYVYVNFSGLVSFARKISMLTHEPLGGGGGFLPPLYVSSDISVTRRANRLKLCIPSHTTILHLLLKNFVIRRIFF